MALENDTKPQESKPEDTLDVPDPEFTIKHPLQNQWTLWFFKKENQKSWEDCQTPVTTFSTVEDFWSLYNHINPASRIPNSCDYSLFKEGVKPMWEDGGNRAGGRWVLNMNKQMRTELDQFWQEILLCLIGEAFDDASDEVQGAVANVRAKGDKLAIWTANCQRIESNKKIGRVMKERLGLPPRMTLAYQSHADIESKTGSHAKNLITL